MDIIEKTLHMVKEYMPVSGTKLGEFTFLSPAALWIGKTGEHPFVAVAEDRWPFNGGGFFLAVTAEGAVYVAVLSDNSLISYCASGFSQFMEIMKLYQAAMETTPLPDSMDGEGMEKCAESERILRQRIMKIDPAAIADVEGFWSTLIEELGAGMW